LALLATQPPEKALRSCKHAIEMNRSSPELATLEEGPRSAVV